MIKLGTSVKLPYSISQGSVVTRFNNACKYNNELFEQLKPQISSGQIPFPGITSALKKITGGKINVQVCENFFQTPNNPAKTRMLVSGTPEGKELSKFEILLPPIYEYSESLAPDKLHIALHETRHIFDQIFVPKITRRMLNINENKSLNPKNVMEFYHKNIYTRKTVKTSEVEQKLDDFLNPLANNDKIDLLQLFRYLLTTEKHAFSDGLKFQRKADKILGGITDNVVKGSEFNFGAKIKLLETKLKEVLNKARTDRNS